MSNRIRGLGVLLALMGLALACNIPTATQSPPTAPVIIPSEPAEPTTAAATEIVTGEATADPAATATAAPPPSPVSQFALVEPVLTGEYVDVLFGNIAVMQTDGNGFNQLTTYDYNRDAVLSPMKQRIAYRSIPLAILNAGDPALLYSAQYNIWIIDVDGSNPVQVTSEPAIRSVPSWSFADERLLFVEGDTGVVVEYIVATGQSTPLLRGATLAKYAPQGLDFAYIRTTGELVLRDQSGQDTLLVGQQGLPENSVVVDFDWFPDGSGFALTILTDLDPDSEFGYNPFSVEFSAWTVLANGASLAKIADNVQGVVVSPDGKLLAGLAGSGFGDACGVDLQMIFLELTDDRKSATVINQSDFGLPSAETGYQTGVFYPTQAGVWADGQTFVTPFYYTCPEGGDDPSGLYALNPYARTFNKLREYVISNP